MTLHDKNRTEAFSDAVIAILITLLVLEIKVPHFEDLTSQGILQGLRGLLPKLLSFVLSFVMIAYYWLWHHNLFAVLKTISSSIIILNIVSLLTVTIMPFTTALLGDYPLQAIPVFIYAVNVFLIRIFMSRLEHLVCGSKQELKKPNKTVYDKRSNIFGILVSILAAAMAFIWTPGAYIVLFSSRLVLFVFQLSKKRKKNE